MASSSASMPASSPSPPQPPSSSPSNSQPGNQQQQQHLRLCGQVSLPVSGGGGGGGGLFLAQLPVHSSAVPAPQAPPAVLGQQHQQHQLQYPAAHQPIARTVSDSSYPRKQHQHQQAAHHQHQIKASSLATSRRKLESEDSSYDSDHEAHELHALAATMVTALPFPPGSLLPQHGIGSHVSKSHDDVSRTPSETLGLEFAEHITQKKAISGASSQHQLQQVQQEYLTSPSQLHAYGGTSSRDQSPGVRHPGRCHINPLVTADDDDEANLDQILHDPTYNSKVEYALRLGYSETLLQKALLKLGHGAGENQILEELIRLQKSKPGKDDLAVLEVTHHSDTDIARVQRVASSGASGDLLPIVIDGSNVAMSHGNKDVFSCKGIQLCVQWFQQRGHKEITVFVPKWRKETPRSDTPISDQSILTQLEEERLLSFTPSRQVLGKRLVCYDDRYILNYAVETGAIVVSNDNYRDLLNDKPDYKKVIEERILMYSFVNDRFMPPDDPMGRNGPTLDQFLRRKKAFTDVQPCPYGKKCTYGNKCKYYHAERGSLPQKSITDKLKEHSYQKINEVRARGHSRDSSPGDSLTRTKSLQSQNQDGFVWDKQALCRARTTVPRLTISETPHTSGKTGQAGQYDSKGITPRLPLGHAGSQPPAWPPPTMEVMKRMPPPPTAPQQQPEPSTAQPWPAGSMAIPDVTMPPPAPRAPWTPGTAKPPQQKISPSRTDQDSNQHRKLARQLTINPTYDPRIAHLHGGTSAAGGGGNGSNDASAGVVFPPRTDIPPPSLPLHATVTRNSSAPEPSAYSPILGQGSLFEDSGGQVGPSKATYSASNPVHGGNTAPVAGASEPSKAKYSLQRMSSTSDSHLHKTTLCLDEQSLEGSFAPSKLDATVLSSAISPLIGASDGVWETSKAQGSSPNHAAGHGQQVNEHSEARSKLYYHLAAVFPESQVLHAMQALPEETNPQKICAFIITLNEQREKE